MSYSRAHNVFLTNFRAIHKSHGYRNGGVQPRTIFITGTDTGVGKTVLTALLLAHLRGIGVPAFALKPFCSGGRDDAQILYHLQDGELTLEQVNPFHFREPLAPLVAARLQRQRISFPKALEAIRDVSSLLKNPKSKIQNPTLLVEGAGGLLTPLGEGFTAADLIRELRCEVIVACANRLGALNHTALTVRSLKAIGVKGPTLVLMDVDRPSRIPHRASRTNLQILRELLHPIRVSQLPYLPEFASAQVKTDWKPLLIRSAQKLRKGLAEIIY